MTINKKMSTFLVFLLLVITSFLFVACGGKNYSNTYLSSTSDYVEVFVGEEKTFTITIEKPVENMSKEIVFSQSNPLIASVDKVSSNKYSSTYSVTGLKGGQGTIDFISKDGGKTKSVQIHVRQYASELKASDSVLYVSTSTQLVPSSIDFDYNAEVTERNLKYYFYGSTTQSGLLILDDIKEDENYVNNFKSAFIYTFEGDNYLIFVDENENYFTLGSPNNIPGSGNKKYNFIEVSVIDNEYSFVVSQSSKVSAGEKFTFVAVYDYNNQEETIYCEKDFSVLNDINKESVEFEYGYKIEGVDFVKGSDLTSYKLEETTKTVIYSAFFPTNWPFKIGAV